MFAKAVGHQKLCSLYCAGEDLTTAKIVTMKGLQKLPLQLMPQPLVMMKMFVYTAKCQSLKQIMVLIR